MHRFAGMVGVGVMDQANVGSRITPTDTESVAVAMALIMVYVNSVILRAVLSS